MVAGPENPANLSRERFLACVPQSCVKEALDRRRAEGTEGRHQESVIRTLTEQARTPDERRRVVEMVRLGHELFWMRWNGVARAMREYLETGSSRYGPLH